MHSQRVNDLDVVAQRSGLLVGTQQDDDLSAGRAKRAHSECLCAVFGDAVERGAELGVRLADLLWQALLAVVVRLGGAVRLEQCVVLGRGRRDDVVAQRTRDLDGAAKEGEVSL